MAKELAKQYDPKDVEDRIYAQWLEGKYFHGKCEARKNHILPKISRKQKY